MEDDQNGRKTKWKITKMEDDQNGRRTKWKMTKMEDDQNGRRPKWKTMKMEPIVMISFIKPANRYYQSEPEFQPKPSGS